MAGADYYLCDRCDAKAFYDAEVEWEYAMVGAMWVFCEKCAEHVKPPEWSPINPAGEDGEG